MDITKRLIELQQRYGWTDYKIAKEVGLSPNTVSNIYRRGNTPQHGYAGGDLQGVQYYNGTILRRRRYGRTHTGTAKTLRQVDCSDR